MYGIELLVQEHENILRMLDLAEKMSLAVLNGKEVPAEGVRIIAECGRQYADRHHHGKEEEILFRKMTEHLGPAADKLIRQGMYVEHDLGRLYVRQLEEALNRYEETGSGKDKLAVVGNLFAYTDLLRRHIAKENEVVYPFGERELSDEVKKQVDQETAEFEERADAEHLTEAYLEQIKRLEAFV